MAMRWIERELRGTGESDDKLYADKVAEVLKARGRDIPLPVRREIYEREKWRIEEAFRESYSSITEFVPAFNKNVGAALADDIGVADLFLFMRSVIGMQPLSTRAAINRAMNHALRYGVGRGTLGELRSIDPNEMLKWRGVGKASVFFLNKGFYCPAP